MDIEAIKGAVRTILTAIGEDPDRPGLVETPRRVAHMYAEMFSGLTLDPRPPSLGHVSRSLRRDGADS